ncbi:hypothetical protein B0H11DRAFT_2220167 [Mycena galericulata]|nr:hypothetical protein B0H11DRAFT_2220167 [Mycena galericulata]
MSSTSVREKTLPSIKNAPLVGLAEGNAQFSNYQLAALPRRVRDFLFMLALTGIPTTVAYWTLMSTYGARKNAKVILPGKDIEGYITIKDPELKKTLQREEQDPYAGPLARSLETLQNNKLVNVCNKLELKPTDRLLDVGCGCGTLVAYAAKNFGCDATGVPADKARILRCDYREISHGQGIYDKIVSLEMAEASLAFDCLAYDSEDVGHEDDECKEEIEEEPLSNELVPRITHHHSQLLESPGRQLRNVCKTPYHVLDAPDLAEDFYLNLVVDWSSRNILGVGLASCVYLWTAHNAAVNRLCNLSDSNDSISSVSWGSTLAVGTISSRLHAHTRIGAIARNAHVLFSGSHDRHRHRDVREVTSRPLKRHSGHRQKVCGLKGVAATSPAVETTTRCAYGISRDPGGATTLGGAARNVGPTPGAASGSGAGGDAPLWKFHEHTAAVKALALDPHVSGVLATGGGTQDKHIRFWNTISGVQSDIVADIFRARLDPRFFVHHRAKPDLHLKVSHAQHGRLAHRAHQPHPVPFHEPIVTGAGDETLRFWNAFPKREVGERDAESRLDYGRLIHISKSNRDDSNELTTTADVAMTALEPEKSSAEAPVPSSSSVLDLEDTITKKDAKQNSNLPYADPRELLPYVDFGASRFIVTNPENRVCVVGLCVTAMGKQLYLTDLSLAAPLHTASLPASDGVLHSCTSEDVPLADLFGCAKKLTIYSMISDPPAPQREDAARVPDPRGALLGDDVNDALAGAGNGNDNDNAEEDAAPGTGETKKKKKKKKPKKKEPEQSDPPRTRLFKFFSDGIYPEGENQHYKDECLVLRASLTAINPHLRQQRLTDDLGGEALRRVAPGRGSGDDIPEYPQGRGRAVFNLCARARARPSARACRILDLAFTLSLDPNYENLIKAAKATTDTTGIRVNLRAVRSLAIQASEAKEETCVDTNSTINSLASNLNKEHWRASRAAPRYVLDGIGRDRTGKRIEPEVRVLEVYEEMDADERDGAQDERRRRL